MQRITSRLHPILGYALPALMTAFFLIPEAGWAGKEPKKRIAVSDFVNEAGYSQHQLGDLGGGMAEKLIEALLETEKFVVLERRDLIDVLKEKNLSNTSQAKPELIGKMTSAQALIRGVITNVENNEGEKGGFGLGKFKIGGNNQRVTVTINLRIIDTVTGHILQSKTVRGIGKQRDLKIRKKNDYGTNLEVKRNRSVGKALDDAIAQAVDEIVVGMGRVPWQGSISRVLGRQVYINAGYQENVEEGLQLTVFERGADIIDSETRETLGRLDEEIGVIRVIQVEPRFSIAEIVLGQGFSPGNIIRPAVGTSTVLRATEE